jgi:hypothetical protein
MNLRKHSTEITLIATGFAILIGVFANRASCLSNDAAVYSAKDRSDITKLITEIDNRAKRKSLPDVVQQAWSAVIEREIESRGCSK